MDEREEQAVADIVIGSLGVLATPFVPRPANEEHPVQGGRGT